MGVCGYAHGRQPGIREPATLIYVVERLDGDNYRRPQRCDPMLNRRLEGHQIRHRDDGSRPNLVTHFLGHQVQGGYRLPLK